MHMKYQKYLSFLSLVLVGSIGGYLVVEAQEFSQIFQPIFLTECADQIDNDGDGLFDFPFDKDCVSLADNSEQALSADNFLYPIAPNPANLTLGGFAFPNREVSVLRDGKVIATTNTSVTGGFSFEFINEIPGVIQLGLIAVDPEGSFSRMISFPVLLEPGEAKLIEDLILPPTLRVWQSRDRSEITYDGYSIAGGSVLIQRQTEQPVTTQDLRITADSSGYYTFTQQVDELTDNHYLLTAHSFVNQSRSEASLPLDYYLDDQIRFFDVCQRSGDLNGDCRVNLLDYSIARRWKGFELSVDMIILESTQLNTDGIIDFQDFGLMAYYWTG
jgi:hypothetical protein